MSAFEQVVFSGGGLRCFWQGGFMDVVRDELPVAPERISSVSGGVLTAAGFVARRGRQVLDRMCEAFSGVDWNVTLKDLDEDAGRTPHQRVYDSVVDDVIDAEAQREIAGGPAYQALIARPPTREVPGLTGVAMTLAYEAELHLVNSPHFSWAERFGLTKETVDARRAAADGTLAELICAAATIPPVFRTPEWDGKPVIDGGMADQAPMPSPDRGRTLVMLTRKYRQLPEKEGRLYVAPSEETPADKIDFTDPDKLLRTWELGRRDGLEFLENWETQGGKKWDV